MLLLTLITLFLEFRDNRTGQLLNPFTLVSVVSPCNINFNDAQTRGEQTSAEWVRIVFHDFITANIAGPGLGGLDASIGFESDRDENVGIFINVTLGQFAQFSSVYLSMADLIGVGLADALATCDPTNVRIPLRVGRIDATGPGPSGVPTPTDSLDFATAAFATAGFNRSEMIQAVACGHSLGGVHHTNFKDIVPDPDDPNNTDGRASFDSTPAVFDNTGVNEYLSGTGLKGGPLVVGPNATNSDLRIFNSDHNATITAMSSSVAFRNTCIAIFEKMLNTVPSTVTLSSPIAPRPWILREGHLDLNSAGATTYSGTITGWSFSPAPATASYIYNTVGGGNTGPEFSGPGAALPLSTGQGQDPSPPVPDGFGTITDYPFSDNPLRSTNINSITIQGSYTTAINQNIFILPSQSFKNIIRDVNSNAISFQYIVRAAILSSLAPPGTALTVKLWYPGPQPNTVVPKIFSTTASMTLKGPFGPSYKVYQAEVTSSIAGTSTFQVTSGTTQVSAKIDPVNWPSCSNSPWTTC